MTYHVNKTFLILITQFMLGLFCILNLPYVASFLETNQGKTKFVPLKKRKVNSLDATFCEANYSVRSPVPASNQKTITGILQRGKERKRLPNIPEKTVKWTNVAPPTVGRHGTQDIVENRPGLAPKSKVRE